MAGTFWEIAWALSEAAITFELNSRQWSGWGRVTRAMPDASVGTEWLSCRCHQATQDCSCSSSSQCRFWPHGTATGQWPQPHGTVTGQSQQPQARGHGHMAQSQARGHMAQPQARGHGHMAQSQARGHSHMAQPQASGQSHMAQPQAVLQAWWRQCSCGLQRLLYAHERQCSSSRRFLMQVNLDQQLQA